MEKPAAYSFKAEELFIEDGCGSFLRNVEKFYQVIRRQTPIQVTATITYNFANGENCRRTLKSISMASSLSLQLSAHNRTVVQRYANKYG